MVICVNENENISMDVQTGPGKEIKVSPVDVAKKDPENIAVGKVQKEKCGKSCCEFYVDLADIEKYAKLNESNLIDSLNDVISCNEASGINCENIWVVVDESTEHYAAKLEADYGVRCVKYVSEAEDGSENISMDVQVGPNDDEIRVEEEPMTANPVDAVKRDYGSVVVAKSDDQFFMDVEDVQKCADINCESVIDTLNSIIEMYSDIDNGPDCDNIIIVTNESTSDYVIDELNDCGVRTAMVR